MADYDFSGLAPADLESLSLDLLQRRLKVRLQGFASGRDKGIDLRYATTKGKNWIVQCKHYARSGYAKLFSHLKKAELAKIKRLKPSRYFLATSVDLTPSNVDQLFDLLSPHCRSKHDIVGRADLNTLLRGNPDIERSHFKLWLTSEAVMSRVLHNEVFLQSWQTEEQIRQKLSFYVRTCALDMARDKLEKERICILSGVPGVGKTTLAEMLLVEYLMDEWHLVAMHQNVAEGQKLFSSDAGAKQIFYYDDFLGQISTGEKLGKNEDRALLQFIDLVHRSSNKRFILTTREYILAQAKAEHEQLARSEIDLYRFVVACEDYSDEEKARILANHLYFAHVPQEHIAALVEKRTYLSIISHRNYNPRIIEWMTQIKTTSKCKPRKYPAAFLDGLNNPSDLWSHAFHNQLSEGARHLLLLLGSYGDGCAINKLRDAFARYYHYRAQQYNFATSSSDFDKALDELEGNFVRIERNELSSGKGHNAVDLVISCHNPSILDFLSRFFIEHPVEVRDVLICASSFEQIERLCNVFWRAPSGDVAERGIDPDVLRDAIDRTLHTPSIRLERMSNTNRWMRMPSSVWTRLRTCCRIGSDVDDGELRHVVQEHIDMQIIDIERRTGELEGILGLLDVVERCDWFAPDVVDRWNAKVYETLKARDDEIGEPLDGLAAAADWLSGQKKRLGATASADLTKNLIVAVKREVDDNTEWRDSTRLGSDLQVLEGIASTLGHSFSDEVRRLNEALNECSHDEPDFGHTGQVGSHHSGGCTSTIESMFDSLLE